MNRWHVRESENTWREAVVSRLDAILALLADQQAVPAEKGFVCPKCGKEFDDPRKLGGHVRWCKGEE